MLLYYHGIIIIITIFACKNCLKGSSAAQNLLTYFRHPFRVFREQKPLGNMHGHIMHGHINILDISNSNMVVNES